jgi:hypothetical protein
MCSYVAAVGTHQSVALNILLSFVRFQAPSLSDPPGFCVASRLTATSKVGLEVGLQLSVAAAMAALYRAVVGVRRWRQRWGPLGGCRPGSTLAVTAVDPEQYVALDGGAPGVPVSRGPSSFSMSSLGTHDEDGDGGACGMAKAPASQRARLVSAAANFGLTLYAALTLAVMKLLHCVWVPGTAAHEHRLFLRASVVCDYSGWQLPLVVALAALAACPLAAAWAAMWSRQGPGRGVGMTPRSVQRGAGLAADVRCGVRLALVDTYREGRHWWEAVLMTQRLVRCPPPRAPHSLIGYGHSDSHSTST